MDLESPVLCKSFSISDNVCFYPERNSSLAYLLFFNLKFYNVIIFRILYEFKFNYLISMQRNYQVK